MTPPIPLGSSDLAESSSAGTERPGNTGASKEMETQAEPATPPTWIGRVLEIVGTAIRRQPVWVLRLEAFAVLAGIGIIDAQTGWETSLYVFYAIPILMSVWFASRADGLVFAALASIVWWVANRVENPYVTSWGYNWATISRFAYFAFMAFGGTALRTQRDNDRARIAALERTRELEKEVLQVSELEQQRIGRDLHDGLCQHLVAVSCSARILGDELAKSGSERSSDARQIERAVRDAAAQARNLARGLFPIQLDHGGLGVALDEMAATTKRLTGVDVLFTETGDTGLADSGVGMQLYRIAQEALGNAIKHGDAKRVEICMSQQGELLILSVADDGRGFTGPEDLLQADAMEAGPSPGMGLRSMRYRARSIDAELEIRPSSPQGTMIICRLVNRPPTNLRAIDG